MKESNNPPVLDPSTWVDAHGDYLYRYVFARLRDSNAAEEVVQETFLAGIRFLDRYNGKGAERAWLLGILKRKLVDHLRMRARFDRDGLTSDGSDPTGLLFDGNGKWRDGAFRFSMPDTSLESRELWDVVRGCLDHMPSGQADAFVLSAMEEMDSDQICRELEITPSNLWVRLHRARLALARCVGSRWFEQDESPARESGHGSPGPDSAAPDSSGKDSSAGGEAGNGDPVKTEKTEEVSQHAH